MDQGSQVRDVDIGGLRLRFPKDQHTTRFINLGHDITQQLGVISNPRTSRLAGMNEAGPQTEGILQTVHQGCLSIH